MGLELAMQVAVECDYEIFIFLLVTIYNNLTLISTSIELVGSITFELGVFRALASTKEATLELLKVELSFFKRTRMCTTTFSPFMWWAKHE